MKRGKYANCILGRGAGIVAFAVLTGSLSFSNSACVFETRTYLCKVDDNDEDEGVRCDLDQTCMRNESTGRCVDTGSCGDGVQNGPDEECDDGNLNPTDGCDLDCKLPVCGDGVVSGAEICDSNNKVPCGVCVSNCTEKNELANATAMIDMTGVIIHNQDTLTLNDGINNPTIFKFVKQDGDSGGAHVVIPIPNTADPPSDPPPSPPIDKIEASKLLDLIITNIEMVASDTRHILLINASKNSAYLRLVHQRKTALGNQAITSTIVKFRTQMMGGAGADCSSDVGCTSNEDCFSNVCSSKTCGCKSSADCEPPLSCLLDGSCGMM